MITMKKSKEVWRTNYAQIESWYQLEYFFDRSYDELAESWFAGEVISIEADGDRDLIWGIKNDTHLNLKLREWVERFDNGEIILVNVLDEIPQKFGGDLEMEGRCNKQGTIRQFTHYTEGWFYLLIVVGYGRIIPPNLTSTMPKTGIGCTFNRVMRSQDSTTRPRLG